MTQKSDSQKARDHRANQLNPNNQAYKAAKDNRANQLNPNNPSYQGSKGGERKGR
jgi:hypothetical protein